MSAVWLFLGKLGGLAGSPIGVVLLLCALALALARGRGGAARLFIALAILTLWIASMPVFANWTYGALEARYPPRPVEAFPKADVIVVLGGIVGQPLPPRVAADLGEPADRLFVAARLYHAGKAPAVLVVGGNFPWQKAVRPESELLADLLVELGVPREVVLVETASRNTFENAVNAGVVMRERGWRSALLVTSGAHMPRAMAAFAEAEIAVVPAAADLRVRRPYFDSPLDFLPDSDALDRTSRAVREWIGLAAYRLRGWA